MGIPVRISAEGLCGLGAAIFERVGCSAAEARRVAGSLVGANLAGHDSHGVIRIPRYVHWLRDGTLVPGRTVDVVTETEAMAVIDGGFGFGQTVGPQAVRVGIDKAGRQGAVVVALRNSGHLGRIGEWAEMAAEAGLVSIHFVNVAGSTLVAPFGGVERRLSTAPIAIGIPLPDRPPVILDFATALVAEGKVLVALSGGKPLPPGSLIGPDGELSTDPRLFYGDVPPGSLPMGKNGPGAIRAFGEHKGSGLALMCELLAGALTGSGCAGPEPRRFANGMLSVYVAPDSGAVSGAASGVGGFADIARAYLDYFTGSRPADPDLPVLLPGDPERRRRAERLAEGVPLEDETWAALLDTARAAGVDPAPFAAQA